MSPEWLFQREEYTPKKDNQRFLDKSIFAILSVINRIKRKGNISKKGIYSVNTTLKVAFTFVNIVLLSLSKDYRFIISFDLYVILCLISLEKENRKNIFLISLLIPIFTFVTLVPSMIGSNLKNSLLILIKIVGTVVSVNILSYTSKWDHITKSLKVFFIPDLFIWVMEITVKYIVLLGEYSVSLLYALKLKSIGINDKKYSSLSKIMGNLFLKSKEMGEEMFSAMECRGFTGEYTSYSKFKINKIDALYFIINLEFIIFFIGTY